MARAPKTEEAIIRSAFVRGLISKDEYRRAVFAEKHVIWVKSKGYGFDPINLPDRLNTRRIR